MSEYEDLSVNVDVTCESSKVSKAFVTELVKSMNNALDKITSSMNSMNANLCKSIGELKANLSQEIAFASLKADAAHDIAAKTKLEMDELRIEVAELRKWCKKLQSESTTVQSQANNMETYSRRDNIIIYGVKEPANESSVLCEKAVKQLFVDQLSFTREEAAAVSFVRCHRLYDRRATRKPIIVRFQNYCDREKVWSNKSAITDKFVRLGEDFPKQIAYNRRKLVPVFVKARNTMDKKLVTLKADNLIINGKKYTVDTLDQLTGELDMRTFCERSNDRILVVGGIFSNFHPLSNYYHANFVFRNQKYSNIEQAVQHVKAVLFGDQAAAAEILSSDDPSAAKRISFSIKGFKEKVRNSKRHDLMLQLVKAKFEQNPELAAELRATGKKILAESGKHNYFANGLSITNKNILEMNEWTAQSKLGEILMTVRRELPQDDS